MTFEYILRKSLCRKEHCGDYSIEARIRAIEDVNVTNEYAEPGYANPDKAILFANWNYFPRGLDSILERYGYAIEWSDEWTTCGNCGRAVRTSPDSYDYQPSYVIHDGEVLCVDCLKDDAESYLESLENNPRKALNISQIDPADYGYEVLQDRFESGLHPGQTDDPKKIYEQLSETHSRLLFSIDEVSQFYTTFSVWSKKDEE